MDNNYLMLKDLGDASVESLVTEIMDDVMTDAYMDRNTCDFAATLVAEQMIIIQDYCREMCEKIS